MDKIYLLVFLTIVHFVKTKGIANYGEVKNLITEDDRRGAEKVEELQGSETNKQKLVAGADGPNTRTLLYLPPGSGHQGGGHGGYGGQGGSFGHSSSGGGYGSSGHGGSFGGSSSHGGGSYGHTGSGSVFGGHSSFGGGHGYGGSSIGGHGLGGYDYGGHSGFGSSGHGGYGSTGSGYGGSTGHGTGYGHSSPSGHGGYDVSNHKNLALKGFLIPLAGIALLGAAAALTTNPVLLQLGVLNGRRRRRSVNDTMYDSHIIYPRNPIRKAARLRK